MSILINAHTKVICQGFTSLSGLNLCAVDLRYEIATVSRILCDYSQEVTT
jgi:hypothetical protein